jgi:hypothetical protein
MTNVISMMRDSLTNLCVPHGERQGRVELNQETPIFDDEQLLNADQGAWLPREIVDIPPSTACGPGVTGRPTAPISSRSRRRKAGLNVSGKLLEARKGPAVRRCRDPVGTGENNLAAPLDLERVGKVTKADVVRACR